MTWEWVISLRTGNPFDRSDRRRRRRQSSEPSVALDPLENRAQTRPRGNRRRKVSLAKVRAQFKQLNTSHFAFLCLGILVGMALGVKADLSLKQASVRQQVDAQVAAALAVAQKPVKPLPPRPKPLTSTPEETVRAMLEAALSNDANAVYALWGVAPNEVAFRSPMRTLSLAEVTRMVMRSSRSLDLRQCTFKAQDGPAGSVQVAQYVQGVLQQIYTLRRTGDRWRIMLAEPAQE
jgi:hypothetical protein